MDSPLKLQGDYFRSPCKMVPKDPSFSPLRCTASMRPGRAVPVPWLQAPGKVRGGSVSPSSLTWGVSGAGRTITHGASPSLQRWPSPPPKNKIKRDLSSSCDSSSAARSSWASWGQGCWVRAWTGGSIFLALVLLFSAAISLQPSAPVPLSAKGHFK